MIRVFPVLLMISILSFGCSEDRALVQVKFYKDTLLTRDMITITIDDGESRWRFGPSCLRSYLGAWSSPEIETRNEGTLLVKYQCKDPEGALVSGGQLKLGLREDWRWGIDIFHSEQNPYHTCFGCFGYKSFPILNPAYMSSDSDSVFVVWGGNSISNPVEY